MGPQAGTVRSGTIVNRGVHCDEMPTPQAVAELMHATTQMANLNTNAQEKTTVIVDRNGTIVDIAKYGQGKLKDLDLSGYDLRNLDWSRVKEITSVNLEGALIGGDHLRFSAINCNFDNVTFEEINLYAKFDNCTLRNASLVGVTQDHDFEKFAIENSDLSGVSITNSTIQGEIRSSSSKIQDSEITLWCFDLDASESEWRNSKFHVDTFSYRDDARGVNLTDATIKKCDIRGH